MENQLKKKMLFFLKIIEVYKYINNIYMSIYILLSLLLFILITIYIQYNKREGFDNKVKLSLLAQMKNETMNLKVWIDHYLWQGVQKIYLIDNGSTDKPLNILQPYIDNGTVFYINLPEKHKQEEHYKQIIKDQDLLNKTEWLIICDLDEFFYGYPNKLSETIDEYKDYDIIISNWRMFGTDGHIKHPTDIRKSIVWRVPTLNENTKYIFKADKLQNIDNLSLHKINNMNNKIIVNDKIRLNHYPIQSLDFFTKVKMTRGDATSIVVDNIRDMNYFNKYNENMTYKDTDLADLIK